MKRASAPRAAPLRPRRRGGPHEHLWAAVLVLGVLVVAQFLTGVPSITGSRGPRGIAGAAGPAGVDGSAGSSGADGFTTLFNITAEAAGSNCTNGGQRIQIGLDNGDGGGTARDGVLQFGEIDATTFVCDGAGGSSRVTFGILSSDFTSTTDTTGTLVSDLTQSLSAGHYTFRYTMIVSSTAQTNGPGFGINFTGASSDFAAILRFFGTSSSSCGSVADTPSTSQQQMCGWGTQTQSTTAPNLGPLGGTSGNSQPFLMWVEGVINASSSGNLELWLSAKSAGQSCTLLLGSNLELIATD